MKDTICVTVDKDHIYNCNTRVVGRCGENECTELEITIAEELLDNWVYLDFKKPDGTTFKTPRLEVIENKVIYDIPYSLIDQKGYIEVQVVLQNEEGVIWKSSIKKYKVNESIDASEDIEAPDDFITNAQKLLDDMTETHKDLEGFSKTKKEELENVKKDLETELINTKDTSITAINNAASNGVSSVNSAATNGVNSVNDASSKALKDINDSSTSSLNAIGTAGSSVLNSIETAKTNAVNDIGTEKTNAITEIENKQKELIEEMNSESAMLKIAELEEEIEKLEEDLETLSSDYEENTVEGESIVISDGLPNSKVAVDGDGKTKQETTEGYQLLDIPETYFWDASVNRITTFPVNLSEGTYTFAFENFTNDLNEILRIVFTDSEGEKYVQSTGAKYRTLNVVGSTSAIKLYVNSSTANVCTLTKGILYSGEYDVNKTYEKYTGGQASPNKNFPQGVEKITEARLIQSGKNRLKHNSKLYIGTNNVFANNDKCLASIVKIEAGQSYVISGDLSLINSNMVRIGFTKEYPQVGMAFSRTNLEGENKTFSTPTNMNYATVMLLANDVSNFEAIKNSFMLEKGTVATEFKAYKEIVKEIDLQGNELAKVSEDIKDKLLIGIDGTCKIDKRVESLELDNTFEVGAFTDMGNGLYRAATTLTKTKNKPALSFSEGDTSGLCTHFKYYFSFSRLKEEHAYLTSKNLYIFMKGISTQEEFIALLKELNPKWYYPLKTPEVIDLPSIEPIKMFEETNIFELETNLGTTLLAVTYKVSNKKKILSLEERIAALESAAVGG